MPTEQDGDNHEEGRRRRAASMGSDVDGESQGKQAGMESLRNTGKNPDSDQDTDHVFAVGSSEKHSGRWAIHLTSSGSTCILWRV